MKTQDASTYQSYLMRLWRDTPQSAWRASLQSSATEAVQHFATVDDLWAFLMAQTGIGDDNSVRVRFCLTNEPSRATIRKG